ncbi:predicted protein [Botrytis cinerea T4]|uniref:Uncharacterized protein n=1 Tax=Botryotinia fuckeliana (strain T4) TaxID=999810 RepID=G2YY02_BOTF4|nr:predicted protein [Botrytis cinerea T4]
MVVVWWCGGGGFNRIQWWIPTQTIFDQRNLLKSKIKVGARTAVLKILERSKSAPSLKSSCFIPPHSNSSCAAVYLIGMSNSESWWFTVLEKLSGVPINTRPRLMDERAQKHEGLESRT